MKTITSAILLLITCGAAAEKEVSIIFEALSVHEQDYLSKSEAVIYGVGTKKHEVKYNNINRAMGVEYCDNGRCGHLLTFLNSYGVQTFSLAYIEKFKISKRVDVNISVALVKGYRTNARVWVSDTTGAMCIRKYSKWAVIPFPSVTINLYKNLSVDLLGAKHQGAGFATAMFKYTI